MSIITTRADEDFRGRSNRRRFFAARCFEGRVCASAFARRIVYFCGARVYNEYKAAGGAGRSKHLPFRRKEEIFMRISGLQKTTLLDFPGRVACTIFLNGCNFRCPFCQNSEILDGRGGEDIAEEELFAFLRKRKGILDGVCVSGGEPLVHAETLELLGKIKALGYGVKLDTNGAFPERLKEAARAGLIDFVAMDIKNSPKNYAKTAGVAVDMAKIEESAKFLMESGIEYEFRTTVVKELHAAEDFIRIGQWLRGAKRYFLQTFRDGDTVLKSGLTACTDAEMQTFKQLLKPYIPNVLIRGEE